MPHRSYLGLLVGVMLTAGASAEPVQKPDEEAGKRIFLGTCSGCHTLEIATAHRMTGEEWRDTVDRMIMMGAELSGEDSQKIVDYLTRHHGLDTPTGPAPAPPRLSE